VSDLGQAITFAAKLYGSHAGVRYAGYLRRDPMARLELRPGQLNPYPIYAELREQGPLTRTRNGIWVSTSHRVCDAVLRDRRFGVRLEGESQELEASFLTQNPPDHTRLRRLALPAFSPKAVASYQPRIERTVASLLDRAQSAGQFDLVAGFAAPLPIAVITDLLGIPDADADAFARYGAIMGSALDGVKSMRHVQQLIASSNAIGEIFSNLFELRRSKPGDDIVSTLIAASPDRISPDEMRSMCVLLLVAGFETTVNLISNAVLALLGHDQQWQALCADPDGLASGAVEEVLRWDPPVQRTERFAQQDLELEGHAIRRGEKVITLIGAANRDPQVYPDPDTFDISREHPAGHLAFSSGIHYCLGQPLARLEATIALRELAARMPGLARHGRVVMRNATTIRGPLHLPVTTQPAHTSRLAWSEGTASRNSGAVQPCRAYASLTAPRTGPLAASGTSASTQPPNPPPIIRAPSAPEASAVSTAASASGQEISKSSRSEACAWVSSRPISR
jgi:P450-derived glycosyltransferase activator